MPKARLKVDLGSSRPSASLRTTGRQLRSMDNASITRIFREHLERAARPYPARVRASALAIPAKAEGKSTGLRERIARCVSSSSWAEGQEAGVSVWVNVQRMLPDYRTLPLYMEGVAGPRGRDYRRWRHPVYGHSDLPWKQQDAHPYFYRALEPLGREAGEALRLAMEDIKRKINS